MKRTTLFWILAFVLTAVAAFYQRMTGPSYPVTGAVPFGTEQIAYRFDRSHGGPSDAVVTLALPGPEYRAVLQWKRFKTNDAWTETPMMGEGNRVTASLPHQPPAGKLVYQVQVEHAGTRVPVPPEPVVIRFKGETPIWIVVPHVLAMFAAMLVSMRTGLEVFMPQPSFRRLLTWTLALLGVGGFILGPLMQLYAFDVLWTGWPVGTDLTDNKTAIAFLGWVTAAIAQRKSAHPARWILGAAVVMAVVYLIPHSLLGSELDYSTLPK